MDKLRTLRPRYDVVIVGARCAGAATAMLLARAGLDVLLVDRQAYGTDTMSTNALVRAGVLQLSRWGLLPAVMAEATPAIRTTTFHYGDEKVSVKIKPAHGVEYLCAPRRTVLDRMLVDAASAAGTEVRHGISLTGLARGAGSRIAGVQLQNGKGNPVVVGCDVVIGADGRLSRVAQLVQARTLLQSSNSSCCVYGYFEGLEQDGSHWHFVENAAAGVIPTNHGQHCVFASVPGPAFRTTFRGNVEQAFAEVLRANSRTLGQNVTQARLVSRVRGFAGAPGHMRQSFGPGWALVGDAGYFKDPLTAHGITDALRDAELLASAVIDGGPDGLAGYQAERDALSRALFAITDSIASFQWSLERVKELHAELSAAMKAETNHLVGLSQVPPLAA